MTLIQDHVIQTFTTESHYKRLRHVKEDHYTWTKGQKVEMKEVVNPKNSWTRPDPTIPKAHHPYMLLTDLFLVLIADSMYDSRSRSLLFRVGSHLSLSWWDIVVFESSIGEACGVTC
ncbi:hypothetical protein C8J55DRAFT_564111 [Lentinula edodes]|uniref:Uncharacterized protein n=1 Tax=Lentinula lateritia TaxID=40482 RepID=A0A9W8ZYY9_9AGAR|nr:hypothetical protein C8J55DRAFT_564111 [Lentinula edodes]